MNIWSRTTIVGLLLAGFVALSQAQQVSISPPLGIASASQDCTATAAGVLTCLKTNNTSFTAAATSAAGQLPATATNDSAAAGKVGEFISSTVLAGSPVNITNATATDITNISLTAGNWLIYGNITALAAGATVIARMISWTSSTSATIPTLPNNGALTDTFISTPAGNNPTVSAGTQQLKLNGTTTVYLSLFTNFSVSTLQAYGFVGALRIR